jgi:hypothetical protein
LTQPIALSHDVRYVGGRGGTVKQTRAEKWAALPPAGKVIVVVLLAALGYVLWSAFSDNDESAVDAAPVGPTPVEITYDVRGSASDADVTVETPTGVSQQQGADIPLRNQTGSHGLIFTFDPSAFVYVSAQNADSYGDVVCTIERDGEVISRNQASGAYAIATCEGTA